jgi:hypothetical protein
LVLYHAHPGHRGHPPPLKPCILRRRGKARSGGCKPPRRPSRPQQAERPVEGQVLIADRSALSASLNQPTILPAENQRAEAPGEGDRPNPQICLFRGPPPALCVASRKAGVPTVPFLPCSCRATAARFWVGIPGWSWALPSEGGVGRASGSKDHTSRRPLLAHQMSSN